MDDNGDVILDLSVPCALTVGETYRLVNKTGVATDARLIQISIYDDDDPDPEIEVKFAGGIQATWISEMDGDGSIETKPDGEMLRLFKPHAKYEPGMLKGGKCRRTKRRRTKRRRTTQRHRR